MPCYSMKMEVPGLADSLQQCLCVNSGIYAGDVLDTDPGWQQSKLIRALSAEVGSASRMHCTGLWHVKAAQQPFRFFHSYQTVRPMSEASGRVTAVYVCVCGCLCVCVWVCVCVCVCACVWDACVLVGLCAGDLGKGGDWGSVCE